MAENERVIIVHADGREYSIRRDDYDRGDLIRLDDSEPPKYGTFRDAGFKIAGGDTRATRAATAKADKDKE